MSEKARYFTNKTVKNIAIILSIIIMVTIILPCTNLVSYGSQYRENTNIDELDENKYPGYKELLKKIQEENPNWTFTFLYTGLDWNTVIYNETVGHGDNLVQGKDGEWVCRASSCINEDGTSKAYEGSNWYCPSTKAVSYYMDPRNFLYTEKLFQFERLSHIEGIYTVEGIEKILAGTFMANTSPKVYYKNDKYSETNFAQIILDAGVAKQISPYHIASRIKQEIIVSGGGPSRSATGTVEGYEGVYNFYNIGASTGAGAIERGLKYAKAKKWTTPEIAIAGGAEYIAQNYIAIGQDTVYLQKFNVDSQDGSLYNHQYQANIQAPESETKKSYASYKELELLDSKLNFVIPLYENMPVEVSAKPNVEYNIVTENVTVIDTNINIRKEKSTESEIIAKVNTGDVLLRIEKGLIKVNDYIWDKVVLSDGTVGYISTQFLQTAEQIITCEEKAYINTNAVVRNGPGIDKTTEICKVQSGETVTILEKAKYTINETSWDKIKLENGTIGYIESIKLTNIAGSKEGDVVKIATSSLPLTMRKEPGTSKEILTKLEKGTLVIRLQKEVSTADGIKWDKIKTFEGTIGYVSAEYLEIVVPQIVETIELNKIEVDKESKVIKCEPYATVGNLQKQCETAVVNDKEGNVITEQETMLSTGDSVTIDEVIYTVVKLGDVSGDGVVDPRDSLRVLRYTVETYELKNEYFMAGDINKDGMVDSRDSLRILRFTVNSFNIEI